MEITLSGKRGRSNVTSTVTVDDLSTEDNLKEVIFAVFDFLIAMGADVPDELLDMLDEYRDD